MSLTLPASAHQHHAEILPHVEALRVRADDLAQPEPADLGPRLAAEVGRRPDCIHGSSSCSRTFELSSPSGASTWRCAG
jgi:hypothetical protein